MKNFKKQFSQFLDVLDAEVSGTWLDNAGGLTAAGFDELGNIAWFRRNIKSRKELERLLIDNLGGWAEENLRLWLLAQE